jgi:hypothetical protein
MIRVRVVFCGGVGVEKKIAKTTAREPGGGEEAAGRDPWT